MREKRPKTAMWKPLPAAPFVAETTFTCWRRGHVIVISALDSMKSPVDGTPVPTWHVSASRVDGVVDDNDLDGVRRAFGMETAEEDNHEPGGARHLFLAVDPAHRADCECNAKEAVFVEANGHRWKAPPEHADARRRLMGEIWGRGGSR